MSSAHQAGPWNYNENNQMVQYQDKAPFSSNPVVDTHVTYTAQGHTEKETTSLRQKTYSYNAAERLVKYESSDGAQAAYQYDPFGRRIVKAVRQGANNTANITYFIYTEQALMGELSKDGKLQRAYGFNPVTGLQGLWSTDPIWQAEINNVNLMDSGATYHYLHTDNLGAPMIATDKMGGITWKSISEAFGATEIIESIVEVNMRLPGHYWDVESGKHYNFHRNYASNTGRYVESDPIGLKGGINLYSYAFANPMYYIDSNGLKAQVCCIPIVSVFGVKAYHCFINEVKDEAKQPCENCDSQTRTLGLQGPPPFGTSKNGNGQKMIDDPFNNATKSICGPWAENCELSKCLSKEYNAYTDPSNYVGATGPNSNTFAYTLASRCGVPEPQNRPWSPGWGQPPAGPPWQPLNYGTS